MVKKDNKKILLIAAGIAIVIIIFVVGTGKIKLGTEAIVNFGILPNGVSCTEDTECSGGHCNSDIQGKKFCSGYVNECASQSCLSNSQSCSFDYLQFKYVIRNAPNGDMLCKLSTNGKQPYFYNGAYNENLMNGADCTQIGQSVTGCSIYPCYCNKNRMGYGTLSTVQNLYDPLSCVNSNTRSVWFYNTFHSSSSQGGCPSGSSCSGNLCKMNDGSVCNYDVSCIGGYCWDNTCHSTPKPTGCQYDNPACLVSQYCSNNVCYDKKSNGVQCLSGTECVSGKCNFNGAIGYCSAYDNICTAPTCIGASYCGWSGSEYRWKDIACSVNYVCSAGTCKKINGQSCTIGSECASGNCISNICTSDVGSFNAETVIASSGISVSGAVVSIFGPMIQTKTTSSGIATFNSIAIGTYNVEATYGGYIPARKIVNVPDNSNHKEYFWFYPLKSDGSSCTMADECSGGYCNKGYCISHTPTVDGGACTQTYDCISTYCNQAPSGKVCSPNLPGCSFISGQCVDSSSICTWNPSAFRYEKSTCQYGCSAGICITQKPDGDSCSQNSDCINNYCFQNICRKDSDGDGNPDYFDSCPTTAQPAISCIVDGAKVLPYNLGSFSFIPQIQNTGNTVSNLQITAITFNNMPVTFTSEIKQTNPSITSSFSSSTVTNLGSLPLQTAGSKTKYALILTGKTTSIYDASDTKTAQMTYYFIKG